MKILLTKTYNRQMLAAYSYGFQKACKTIIAISAIIIFVVFVTREPLA
jgi:hypothetical protein